MNEWIWGSSVIYYNQPLFSIETSKILKVLLDGMMNIQKKNKKKEVNWFTRNALQSKL